MKACNGVLKKLECTNALYFVAEYLYHSKPDEMPKYFKTLVGVKILKRLDSKDRALYIHLIKEPMLMLEQLLMNCKLESLQTILNELHEYLKAMNLGIDIGIDNFNNIIRFYAKKSLDFRVSLQRDGIENKGKSISESSLESEENDEFIMPINVPTKKEWVPNDKVNRNSSVTMSQETEIFFSLSDFPTFLRLFPTYSDCKHVIPISHLSLS